MTLIEVNKISFTDPRPIIVEVTFKQYHRCKTRMAGSIFSREDRTNPNEPKFYLKLESKGWDSFIHFKTLLREEA